MVENNSCSKSKITAGILAILLGGFGVHKFYLGKASGIIYLLFCWTFIPWLVAIIEGIIYLSSSDEKFAKRYVKKAAVKYTEAGTTIRQEINTLRVQISGLNQRVNNLEGNLVKKDIAEPKPEPVVQPQEKVEEVQEVRPIISQAIAVKEDKIIAEDKPRKKWSGNFEQILGEKWFNKLGIFAVVIGVALLIGYSFRYMGPVAKILIGYAFGFGFLIAGSKVEKIKNFSVYGKTLIAGGWAINYFVTFAMHHIPIVRIIESPIVGMILLLIVSIATIAHTYKYKSQVATAFSYLLIFATFLLQPISYFTLVATIFVAASLIFFMYKFKWHKFALYGMLMCYLTFMVSRPMPSNKYDFFILLGFLLIYWAIFTLASFLMKDERDNKQILPNLNIRDLTYVVNNLAAFAMTESLVTGMFSRFLNPVLGLWVVLYVSLTAYAFLSKRRYLCLISSTFAFIFSAMLLYMKFSGYSLTVTYILLAQIILLSGVLLKEVYWRLFSVGFMLVILAKLLLIDSFFNTSSVIVGNISTRTLLFGFAFVVYFLGYILYTKLKQNNELTEYEKKVPVLKSYLYPVIFIMGTWLDLPKVLIAPCWIILGVLLLQFGVAKNNYHQRLQGYIIIFAAFLRMLMSNMTITGGMGFFSYRLMTVIPVILLLYYCVMLLTDKESTSLLGNKEKGMNVVFSYLVFIGIMFLTRLEVGTYLVAPVWGAIACIYALIGIRTKKNCCISISSIAAIATAIRVIFVNIIRPDYLVGAVSSVIYPIITIAALYAGNILYFKAREDLGAVVAQTNGRIKKILHSSRFVFGLLATAALTTLLIVKLSGVLLTVALGVEGLMLFVCGFGIKERQWRIQGLVILLVVLLKVFVVDLRQLGTLYYILSLIVLGIVFLFVSYLYTQHKDTIKKLI